MEEQLIQKLVDRIVLRDNVIYNTVYFYGDKSRIQSLLTEIETTYTERYPAAKTMHTDANTFLNETIRNVIDGSMSDPHCECDLFIFENIERIAGMGMPEQRLYVILDWLLETGRQIIVTGATPTTNISRLAPRICAQLDGGVSFCISTV